MNVFGAMYAAVLFLGATNAAAVQSIIAIERTVFYRERAAGMYSPMPYAFSQVKMWGGSFNLQDNFYLHPFLDSPSEGLQADKIISCRWP